MKKVILFLCLLWFVTLIIGFFLYSDMVYQKDVAYITADWCRKEPTSFRCNFGINVGHNWDYLLIK